VTPGPGAARAAIRKGRMTGRGAGVLNGPASANRRVERFRGLWVVLAWAWVAIDPGFVAECRPARPPGLIGGPPHPHHGPAHDDPRAQPAVGLYYHEVRTERGHISLERMRKA